MPAYSILAWLRRRRAVTRGVRRPTEAFRSAFSMFTGRYYSARPPLLLPPVHWRELLRAAPADALEERAMFADVDADVAPVMETEERATAVGMRSAPRDPYRPKDPRQILPSRAERFVAAVPAANTRREDDSVPTTGTEAASTSLPEALVTKEPAAQRGRTESPPREAASIAPLEPFAPQPQTVKTTTAASSVEPLGARTSVTPEVRSTSAPPADATGAVAPLEATVVDQVSKAATPAVPPTIDIAALQPVEPGGAAQIQREVPARSPRVESPMRAPASASKPPESHVEIPPAASRHDRVSSHVPPSPRSAAIEPKPEPAISSGEVDAGAELTPVQLTAAPASSEPAVATPGEQGVAPRLADVVRAARVDDSLIAKVEAHRTDPVPSRAPAVDRDVTAPEMPVAQPATTTKTEPTIVDAAAAARPEYENAPPEPEAHAHAAQEAALVNEPRPASPTNIPSGIRPTEERRGRRSRPPAPSEAPPQPQATAPQRAKQSDESAPRTDAAATAERSMVDWRRLLFEATTDPHQRAARAPSAPERGKENVSPAATSPKRAPVVERPPVADTPIETEPLLESTRRFLRPRVGIDPATVPVVRGPVADRLVRDAGADAVAVADAVVLPSSFDERSPKDLGLLAHELTHVAQRRQPRFVPPAVRSAHAPARSIERGEPSRVAMPFSEEQLARQVERSVWNDAERIAPEDREVSTDDVSGRDAAEAHAAPSYSTPRARHQSSEWGGLPAPWEPLPAFTPTIAEPVSAPVTVAASTGEQTIHYAEHGRSLEGEQAPPTHEAQPTGAAPPPDLDALARRVYDVLKRRLAAERRREG